MNIQFDRKTICESTAAHYETCLYRIPMRHKAEVERLFVGYGDPERHGVPTISPDGELVFRKQSTIDFDRLMSAFFDNVWFEDTSLERVILRGEIIGPTTIELLRKTADGSVMAVGRDFTDADKCNFELTIDKKSLLSPSYGRHWIVVRSSGPFRIRNLAWYTDQPPQRDVSLGIVLATFNRPDFLARTVRSMLLSDEAYDAIGRVIVVNQGDEFDLEHLVGPDVTDRVRQKVTVIKQGNFGGAGGFTRGMMAVSDDPSLTHVVLCDDDIVLEPSSIARTRAFFRYAHDKVALGGLMLDLLEPNSLYECGAFVDPVRHTARPHKHRLNMAVDGALDTFNEREHIDFNGWWFFGFDKKLLGEVGYPLPCFIRGDDVEFGVRLNKAGVRTVALPGIVVWHEPFYLKLGGWHYYFEVRNRLIYAALYRPELSPEALIKPLADIFLRDLATCRYYTAKLCLLAIEDFLGGEAQSLANQPGTLQRVLSFKSEFGPKTMSQTDPIPPFAPNAHVPRLRPYQQIKEIKSFLQHMYREHRPHYPLQTLEAHRFNYWNTRDRTAFVVREPDRKTHLLYKRNPRLTRELLADFRKLKTDFKARYQAAATEYRDRKPVYTSREVWEKRLAMSGA